MMTEDEAKTKFCPMTLSRESGDEHSPCCGSACMAWQFVPQLHHREKELWSRSKNEKVNSAWGDDAWWRPIGENADKEPPAPVGFCAAFPGTRG